MSNDHMSRRKWLKTVSVGGVVGLAGCTGGGNGSGGNGSGGNGSGSGSGSQGTFRVGAVYPFSGSVAETGQNIRKFINNAVTVVNEQQSGLDPLVMSSEAGLSELGTTVEVTFADHRSDPAQGRSEAERLVQEENVDMLVGAYNSSVTKTVSQVAEREQVPHVNFESSSPDLTERGLNWFWRTGPTDQTYTQDMFAFFSGLSENSDMSIETVAIIHEDTEFGTVSARAQEELAKQNNMEIVAGPISYTAESVSSLQSEVQRIQQADPDVLLPSSYVRDAQILLGDMQNLGYFPKMVMGQNAGFNQPGFIESTELSNYVCSRSTYADDLPENVPELGTYNEFVNQNVGLGFNGVYIRSWGGFIGTMYAVNQAGSADPGAIQSELNSLQMEQLNTGMPYGIQFNENGQNELASGVLLQYRDATGNSIYPFELAAAEVEYPAPGWGERN